MELNEKWIFLVRKRISKFARKIYKKISLSKKIHYMIFSKLRYQINIYQSIANNNNSFEQNFTKCRNS